MKQLALYLTVSLVASLTMGGISWAQESSHGSTPPAVLLAQAADDAAEQGQADDAGSEEDAEQESEDEDTTGDPADGEAPVDGDEPAPNEDPQPADDTGNTGDNGVEEETPRKTRDLRETPEKIRVTPPRSDTKLAPPQKPDRDTAADGTGPTGPQQGTRPGLAQPAGDSEAGSDTRSPADTGNPATASPALQPPVEEDESLIEKVQNRFRFGSYGRVQPAFDLEGGPGRQTRIVFPSPRVDESSYVELEFGYLAYRDSNGVEVDTNIILAFNDDLFHFNGDFDATPAIRNLYAEVRNLIVDGTVLWAGSRMYRGDDVYLMDFWPLDNLNTYGGGFGYRGDKTRIMVHSGLNRLDDEYQFQVVNVVDERFVGAREVVFLDRARSITSLKGEQQFGGRDGAVGHKVKLYGEFHYLPEGTLRREQPTIEETLPEDFGFVVGAQYGVWNFLPRSFVNVFVRYSSGLAAYGETAIPFGLDQEKQAASADNLMIALSANFETEWFGVLVGGYARYFTDADRFEEDFDDGWDASWAIRPMAFIGDYFTPGFEVSQQLRRPNGVNPVSGLQETAQVWKFSVLPAVTFGEGMYARPQLRLNYTVSVLNDAAQDLFPIDDRLRNREVVHYLGLAAEWWFNSSSYQ